MATNSSLKSVLAAKKGRNLVQGTNDVLKGLLDSEAVLKRLEKALKENVPQYMSSILNLVNNDVSLQSCEPMSIIESCMTAADLSLNLNKNLGYMKIENYKGKAIFQMGYRGYMQLALRTAQYRVLNVIEVYEGELISWNQLTEDLKVDYKKKKSDAVIGYAGFLELINGFRKSTYWPRESVEKYRRNSINSEIGWNKNFDGMAKKIVIRDLLFGCGIFTAEMQRAYSEELDIENKLH